MYCNYCGKVIQDDANICAYCGVRVGGVIARKRLVRPRVGRAIAGVWRDVLRLDDVGVDDNFFDLGGHSLLLVQVQAKLRDVLEREIAIVEMFQYPTIRAMATHLARSTAGAPAR